MMLFEKGIKGGRVENLAFHLIPAFVVVALFEIVSIEVYLHAPISSSKIMFFVWRSAQAIGSFLAGYISDKLNRKTVLIISQVLGVVLLPFLFYTQFSLFSFFLIGFFFTPSPIARAALVDSFVKESKAKLIAITYIAQFIPWCFYLVIKKIDSVKMIVGVVAFLVCNSICTFFLFKGKKNLNEEEGHLFAREMIYKGDSRKLLSTLGALVAGQIVFFVSDTFFENLSHNEGLFSALGIGSLIGVIIGICYRTIPHLSLLTFCFGIGVLLSLVPFVTSYFSSELPVDMPYQLMLLSNLGGFYLPFVFDVVLSAVSRQYRGTMCGMIDLAIGLSSVIGVSVVTFFSPNETTVLLMVIILFSIAAFIQKLGEKHG